MLEKICIKPKRVKSAPDVAGASAARCPDMAAAPTGVLPAGAAKPIRYACPLPQGAEGGCGAAAFGTSLQPDA